MTDAPNSFYLKARAETAALLGYTDASLTAEQATRLDIATALRISLDHEQAKLLRGEPVVTSRLLDVAEALGRLVPAMARPPTPASRADDPSSWRAQMLAAYFAARERGAQAGQGYDGLQRENERLRAEVAALKAGGVIITPSEADVTPPSEMGEFYRGPPRPGPDDPKPVTVIEAKATAAPAAEDLIDIRNGWNDTPEPWRDFSTDVEGNPLTARGSKFWGPV